MPVTCGAAQVQAPEPVRAPAAAAVDEDQALLSLLPPGKKKKKKGGKAAAAPGEAEHDVREDTVASDHGAAANGTGLAALSRMWPGILGHQCAPGGAPEARLGRTDSMSQH